MDQIVRRHFKKKTKEIIENTDAVIANVKPGFLFDLCACDESILSSFIREVNKLREAELILVSIDESHLFIVNSKEAIIAILKKALSSEVVFVDISSELSEPKIIANLSDLPDVEEMLCKVAKAGLNEKEILKIELEPGWNGCTLFGILCGFPIVYVYDVRSSTENCLSSVDLLKIQALQNGVVISSFTVPNNLVNASLKAKLSQWKEQFEVTEESRVSFPVVVM